ncbi:MAG TPA: phospholipase D family protein [Gammaproteobacteria bacterium]|nr:phospholipase D family protein [Gammaproteobacteria bacterium]
MPGKRSLDPEDRTLYGANLRPPPGYTFDAAVASTFSLDFETMLAVPVSLALFAAENRDDIVANPLALLEGVQRIAGRLAVFSDAGRIQAQTHPQSRLCSLLEKIVVEVAAPGGGAFHPKLWVLRFQPMHAGDPVRLRLLILSRNLTRDRSWDTALTLDGHISGRRPVANRPLVNLIRRLPGLATAGVPEGTRELVTEISEDLRRVEWRVPEPFDNVSFAVNGLGGKLWKPEGCARLGVISPFCDEATLRMLAQLPAADKPVFVGRSDELAALSPAALEQFERVAVLDEMATTEDGEEGEEGVHYGLHAKVYVAESGWNTIITVGSGNATRPALSGRNVELFATLTGKRSRVGSVEEILGEAGFGRLTRPFIAGEVAAADPVQRDAEARLDVARNELCGAGLRLRCEREPTANGGASLWRMRLTSPSRVALAGVGKLRIWPITRGEGHGRDVLEALRCGESIDLGAMALVDVTRFMAFQLTDDGERASLLFSTGLALDGLPAQRQAALLRLVIDNNDAFFRYLRLLLSGVDDPFAAALAARGDSSRGNWRGAEDDVPLLEEMVRAFCRGGEKLRAIKRLIEQLGPPESGQADPVPPEFRLLWDTFRAALNAQEPAHAE